MLSRDKLVHLEAAIKDLEAAIKYINRLSDHLFVLSRHVNDNGAKDVLWVPGKNR